METIELGTQVTTMTGITAWVESCRIQIGSPVYTLIDIYDKPVWNGDRRGFDESQVAPCEE